MGQGFICRRGGGGSSGDSKETLLYENNPAQGKGAVTLVNESNLNKYSYIRLIYYIDAASSKKLQQIIFRVADLKTNAQGSYPYSNFRIFDSINSSHVDYVYRKIYYQSGSGLILSATTGDGLPVSGYLTPYRVYGFNETASISPVPGFAYRTGSKSMSEVNSNANIIPISARVSISQVAATQWGYVKYNNANICSFRQYEGTGTLNVFFGNDALNGIKGQIGVVNCTVSSVTSWLEKVDSPASYSFDYTEDMEVYEP